MTQSESSDQGNRSRRIIVKFNKAVRESQESLDAHCDQVKQLLPGGQLVRPPSRSGRAVFDVSEPAELKALADKVSDLDGIEYAEPDELDSAT